MDGLGKGERIYSVRFIGPRGYVVTFRQTDPLYSLDLSDPAKPRVTGELKITGYSAHLQPAGDGRLIGIGQEADTAGPSAGHPGLALRRLRPRAPRRLAQHHVTGGQSEAEYDPHALLWWPATNLLVVPITEYGPAIDRLAEHARWPCGSPTAASSELGMLTAATGRSGYRAGLRRRGSAARWSSATRSWTMSDSGLQASRSVHPGPDRAGCRTTRDTSRCGGRSMPPCRPACRPRRRSACRRTRRAAGRPARRPDRS